MAITVVSTNFDFLRWKYGTHKALQRRLQDLVSWNDLSAFALGNKAPSDALMRKIEVELKLQNGWLERDNIELLNIQNESYEMLRILEKLGHKERKAVFGLVAALGAA